MQQNWEYLVLEVFGGRVIKAGGQTYGDGPYRAGAPGLQAYLTERGREGWELMSSDSLGNGVATIILKRPAQIGAPVAGVTKEAGSWEPRNTE